MIELLEKANIKVPHFVGPKLLSFIVTVHDDDDATESDNDEIQKCPGKVVDKSTSKLLQKKSQNQIECKTKSKASEVIEKAQIHSPQKLDRTPQPKQKPHQQQPHQKQQDNTSQNAQPDHQLNNLAELKEVQSFGSLDLIPVSNALTSDAKRTHEKPVKNFVEITPLVINDVQNEKVTTKTEIIVEKSVQPKGSACVEGKTQLRKIYCVAFYVVETI